MWKNIHKNSSTNAENGDCSGVKYPTDIKSVAIWSKFGQSRVYSHIEELWYNESLYIYIYIYIYIYVCICMLLFAVFNKINMYDHLMRCRL